jgi:hypothetical protein
MWNWMKNSHIFWLFKMVFWLFSGEKGKNKSCHLAECLHKNVVFSIFRRKWMFSMAFKIAQWFKLWREAFHVIPLATQTFILPFHSTKYNLHLFLIHHSQICSRKKQLERSYFEEKTLKQAKIANLAGKKYCKNFDFWKRKRLFLIFFVNNSCE